MNVKDFTVIGENIHCTRIVLREGKRAFKREDGTEAVAFSYKGEDRVLPIPSDWGNFSPAFEQGKVKHAALALYSAMNGSGEQRKAGEDYLCWLAEEQVNAGTTFLDVNVDEYSTDKQHVLEAMKFIVDFLSSRFDVPLSIDSSDPETLSIGLSRCRTDIKPPMVNSVSLEREEAVDLLSDFNGEAIVTAAGGSGMPGSVDERMSNLRHIIKKIVDGGFAVSRLHVDALVLPISTDPMNGSYFMETTAAAVKEFPSIHASGGLSNVSFGMPRRKLLNMTFTRLAAEEYGLDGGIIDPIQMPVNDIAALDMNSEPFQLARAVLTGEDMFGMEFIAASRDGRI